MFRNDTVKRLRRRIGSGYAALLLGGVLVLSGCDSDAKARVAPGMMAPPTPAGGVAVEAPAEARATMLEPFMLEIPGSQVKLEMVPIPGGEYEFTDPSNPGVTKTITIPAMWVAKTELPWDAFDVYVYRLDLDDANGDASQDADAVTRPSKPYVPPDRGYGHEGYPAIGMSHHNATQFCAWLSKETSRDIRLPTEAEWEYAARAGRSADEMKAVDLGAVAWHYGNANFKTNPVGKKKANPWGLHDMLGNVAEWCHAGQDETPVVRGGSWDDDAEDISWTKRQPNDPMWNASDPQIPKSKWWLADSGFVGFRIVCLPEKTGTNQQGDQQKKD